MLVRREDRGLDLEIIVLRHELQVLCRQQGHIRLGRGRSHLPLRAGHVEELSLSIARVVLGRGKRLIDDFDETVSLEHVCLLQSPFATHITYGVVR